VVAEERGEALGALLEEAADVGELLVGEQTYVDDCSAGGFAPGRRRLRFLLSTHERVLGRKRVRVAQGRARLHAQAAVAIGARCELAADVRRHRGALEARREVGRGGERVAAADQAQFLSVVLCHECSHPEVKEFRKETPADEIGRAEYVRGR